MDFKDKVAIITGASRGIGKSIAKNFAKSGANLVLSARNAKALEVSCLELSTEYGVKCEYFAGDVSKPEVAEGLVKAAIDNFGCVDILVNNAGITSDSLIMKMKLEDWNSVIDTNLTSAFNTIKAVSRHMLKQKNGYIINISSIIGMIGNAGQANYAASKAGLIALTKTAAKEFASRGVTCNGVAPGFIQTQMTQSLPGEVKEKYKSLIPLGDFGSPEDVARVVLFLASSRYITGQVISVDGGINM